LITVYEVFTEIVKNEISVAMQKADESPLTVDEITARLKCSRGWVQLSIDAGCPVSADGRVCIRDFMIFQLTNINKIRLLAGLPLMSKEGEASAQDLRPNVKAILKTQLEWLQIRSTKAAVKTAAKLVYDRIDAVAD